MRLAPTSDDFESDDEEASYYDDNVIYVEDDKFSCETMCINNIKTNILYFSVVDGKVLFGGKALEFDPSEYL